MMDRITFIEKLKDCAENHKTLYVLGCFGAPLNSKNKERYTNNQVYNGKPIATTVRNPVDGSTKVVNQSTKEGAVRKQMILSASEDTFGFDCVCLIKGILWGWNGDTSKTYGGAGYGVNGVPDVGANTMMNRYCTGVSTDFTNIEVGEAVWMEGHIGVYVGNGQCIECTPKWENRVQYSNLGNIGNKTGNYRIWQKHGKLPWVDYSVESNTESNFTPTVATSGTVGNRTYIVKKGDTLTKIAKDYNTTIDKIVADNIKAHKSITRDHIVTGWKLTV